MPIRPSIEVGADRFAVRLVDQAQHRVGVRVVDEFVRQEGVQQRLDRRVRRRGIEQVRALDAHHVLVAERGARAQLAQAIEPHRRQARRLDRRHVRARALDAEHLDLVAEEVGHASSSPRCCRRRAARAWDRGRAGAWCRRAAPDRGRRRRGRSDRPPLAPRCRPSRFSSHVPVSVRIDAGRRARGDGRRRRLATRTVSPCRARACSTSRSGADDRRSRFPPGSTPPAPAEPATGRAERTAGASSRKTGATGSRTVERRRGGSGAGSGTTGAGASAGPAPRLGSDGASAASCSICRGASCCGSATGNGAACGFGGSAASKPLSRRQPRRRFRIPARSAGDALCPCDAASPSRPRRLRRPPRRPRRRRRRSASPPDSPAAVRAARTVGGLAPLRSA